MGVLRIQIKCFDHPVEPEWWFLFPFVVPRFFGLTVSLNPFTFDWNSHGEQWTREGWTNARGSRQKKAAQQMEKGTVWRGSSTKITRFLFAFVVPRFSGLTVSRQYCPLTLLQKLPIFGWQYLEHFALNNILFCGIPCKKSWLETQIPSVTLANYGTTVMGNYGKSLKLQIVFTIRLHL